MEYSFMIGIVGDIVGMLLHDVGSIAHGHSATDVFQHLYIVGTVAESHGFIFGETEVRQHLLDTYCFAAAIGDKVAEQRMPTGHTAVAEDGKHFGVAFNRLYGNILEHIFSGCFGKGANGRHLESQLLLQLFGDRVGAVDEHLPFGETHGAHGMALHIFAPATAVVGVEGKPVYHGVASETEASIDSDIAIESEWKGWYEHQRPAGRDKCLDTIPVQQVEGLNGAWLYLVGLEAEQGAVDVEEDSFYHVVSVGLVEL